MELQTSTSYSGKIISFGLKDFLQLIKHRLTSTVVFSAGIGFILGSQGNFLWNEFFLVLTSGFFITAGANIANQVIEKDTDKLMSRTKNRPLVTGRVQPWAASILSILFGAIGVSLLALFTNPLSAGIAFASFVPNALILYDLDNTTFPIPSLVIETLNSQG